MRDREGTGIKEAETPSVWNSQETSVWKSLVVFLLAVFVVALAARVHAISGEATLMSLLFVPVFLALFVCRFAEVVTLGALLSLASLWLGTIPAHPFRSLFPFSAPVVTALSCNLIAIVGGLGVRHLQAQKRGLAQRLFETEEREQIMRWVEASESLEDAADIVLLALQQMHPSHTALLYLLEETRTQLVPQGVRGMISDRVQARVPERLEDWGGEEGLSTAHLLRARSTTSPVRLLSLVPNVLAGLVLPLFQADSRLQGVLILAYVEDREVSPQEIERLRGFFKEVALALERIRLRENLHGMAFSDALTGLKNYRAFRDDLSEELRRAERYKHAVSLLILDIDRFKNINDRHGHPLGNRILKHVAAILQANLRDTDMPARYGGEEFVALCPETGKSEALVVAERIRRAVQNTPFRLSETETLVVTVSVGVATYPLHAESELGLLEQADAALYSAKGGGRNQSVLADALIPAIPQELPSANQN